MTAPSASTLPSAPRGSRFWRIALRVMYRFLRLVDPLIRSWVANGAVGLDGIVEVRVTGRRSGRQRSVLLTLLSSDGGWYLGHPNGDTEWTRNAEAAGVVQIDPPGAHGRAFRVVRLLPGLERDAVIRATRDQQPFPANLIYRAASRHIAAVGIYFRLVPAPDDEALSATESFSGHPIPS
jgi:hypothetical protein